MNIKEIKREIDAAPYGAKSEIVKRYAAKHQVSEKTIYRLLAKAYGKKRMRTKKSLRIEEDWIDMVAMLKAESMSYGAKEREYKTEDAIEQLETSGMVPLGALKISTVNRRLQEAGFREGKPAQRYLEKFSNQCHYIDASRSEYISVVKYDPERDEYLLRTSPKSLRYKNKEGKSFGLWLAGLRDGRSGLRLVKYYTVTGENAYMGLDFLQHCWSRPADDYPLNSFPYFLKMDNGPLAERKEVLKLLEALQVEQRKSAPYNKKAMGKIERPWRTFWQSFELKLVMQYGIGKSFYVSELNQMAHDYCVKESLGRHSIYRNVRKRDLYESELLAYPPRVFEGDFFKIASRPMRRKVGGDLIFWIENEPFQAPERYLGKWVLVHKNLHGDLVGEGEEDGQIFTIRERWEPQEFDDYKAFPDTYRERMLKASKDAPWNVERMQPKPQEIVVESPHLRDAERQIYSLAEAKNYIVQQLHLESYLEVAGIFDPLLAFSTEKSTIDQILKVYQTKVG